MQQEGRREAESLETQERGKGCRLCEAYYIAEAEAILRGVQHVRIRLAQIISAASSAG